jgi:hypothetical protein
MRQQGCYRNRFSCIQFSAGGVLGNEDTTMWSRRDWDDFFGIVKRQSRMQRPPRPLDKSHRNRLVPAEGFSLAELDDAGLSVEKAETLGLPVDAGRVGSYGPNISTLREYLRATRTRL